MGVSQVSYTFEVSNLRNLNGLTYSLHIKLRVLRAIKNFSAMMQIDTLFWD